MKSYSQVFPAGLLLLFIVQLIGCTENTKVYTAEEIAEASEKANTFFDTAFDDEVDRWPTYQSFTGIKKDYDKWDDLSEEFLLKEHEIYKKELQYVLDSIDPASLNEQTLLSYKLFKESRSHAVADFKWRHYNYPVDQMYGWHGEIPSFLINIHTIANRKEAEDYIVRLHGIPVLIDQLIERLKIREKEGIVPPRFVFPYVLNDCRNVLTGQPFEDGEPGILLADFKGKVDTLALDNEVKATLISRATEALKTSLRPSYEKLIAFLEDQETRATTDHGVWKFPNGLAFYDNALKRMTTTDLTAEEIHETGLNEVARIHEEMRKIMEKVGFEGDLKAFFTFLKEDEQFYYPNTDAGRQAYLDSATSIIDNMQGRLDELFITQPQAKIQVKRVEPFREASTGSAFYQRGTPDGSRPGAFYVNLHNMKDLPKFEMEALAYHEGIPGHHMDRSISQELKDIPKFRKYLSHTARIEGWGLYCEYIPKEMGLYENPYADYGRLAMELWRACRLVVDTGIHLKKWTREEGIEYYRANTSGSERECERMVERHIVMPAQATAYKIGMLKILELRKKAKDTLGDAFDIREFHDVILTRGSVPLSLLEQNIDDYISAKQNI